jgi:hypothetical protein
MLKDKGGGGEKGEEGERGRAPQHVFKGTACVCKVQMEEKQLELKSKLVLNSKFCCYTFISNLCKFLKISVQLQN